MKVLNTIKRFFRKLDWFNWLRFRIWERHHSLTMRYIKPGWCDKDEILIHAMFEVLCRFIEDENPKEWVNWNSDPQHKHAWSEMNDLYKWWINKRQKNEENDPLFKSGVHAPTMNFIPDGKSICNPISKKIEKTSELKLSHKTTKDEQKWKKACEDSWKWEEKCKQEDEKNMIRLIKIRHFMWT